jgi:hypothetical protein
MSGTPVSIDSRFSLAVDRRVLESTPVVLRALLTPLPPALLDVTEGPGTWTPRQVVAHLAWGEHDDWVPRVRRILASGSSMPFDPFDREAGFDRYRGWPLDRLLDELASQRARNLRAIDELALSPADLAREGRHPEFGPVTLEQLLATWVTHDCAHVAQIARILTKHYGRFIGPWRAYFSLLNADTPAT